MQVGVMITNGGPHSAEKWAAATAGQIIQIAADAKGVEALEGRKLELKIIDMLEQQHRMVQNNERSELEKSDPRAFDSVDPNEHDLDGMLQQLVAVAKGTTFEPHFNRPDVRAHVKAVLASHIATSMHIERSWHRDSNPALRPAPPATA